MPVRQVLLYAAVAAMAALAASTGQAAVIVPYVNDFSTSVADFTETTDAQWTLNTTTGLYTNSSTQTTTATSAVVLASELGGPAALASDFTMTSVFTPSSMGADNTTIGMAALGTTASLSAFYLGDVQRRGNMRLFRVNPNSSLKEEFWPGGALVMGTTYTMTLTGTYGATGDLTLALTLAGGGYSHTITSNTIAAANVLQGQYFGLRDRTDNPGGLTTAFDSFSLTPEPATFALLGLGALGILRRRWA